MLRAVGSHGIHQDAVLVAHMTPSHSQWLSSWQFDVEFKHEYS